MSAGVTDAMCYDSSVVPAWERGIFGINLLNSAQAITDGLSNTFMVGEAAQGSKYILCRSISDFTTALTFSAAATGTTSPPVWAWIAGETNSVSISILDQNFVAGGSSATTLQPLNKYPVVQTKQGANITIQQPGGARRLQQQREYLSSWRS